MPRNLVVRYLPLAKLANIFCRRVLTLAENNPRTYFLAVFTIWNTEYLDRLNLRMPEQEFFDLARVNVLADTNQHVLYTSDDIAISLSVEGRQIACMHPAVDNRFARFFFVAPIPFHHRITARAEFACLTDRDDFANRINQLHLQMRLDLTNGRGAFIEGIGGRALKRHRARLRHSVCDRDFAQVHLRDHALHGLDRAGRTRHDPDRKSTRLN